MRLRLLFLSALLLVLPMPLLADTLYTYTYTGNNFNLGSHAGVSDLPLPQGPFTSSDFVSGYFKVAAPLAPNLSQSSPTVLAFDFTNGVSSGVLGTTVYGVTVWTDGSGNITYWQLGFGNSSGTMSSNNYLQMYSDGHIGAIQEDQGAAGGYKAYVMNDPGTWTEAITSSDPPPVPEPSTLLMLGTGVFGLAGTFRKRSLAAEEPR